MEGSTISPAWNIAIASILLHGNDLYSEGVTLIAGPRLDV